MQTCTRCVAAILATAEPRDDATNASEGSNNWVISGKLTTTGRPGTYLPNGVASGFVPVRTPKIDIVSPGLYYVATVFPGQPRNFEIRPTAAQLAKLRKERPELAGLKPVNFGWSN